MRKEFSTLGYRNKGRVGFMGLNTSRNTANTLEYLCSPGLLSSDLFIQFMSAGSRLKPEIKYFSTRFNMDLAVGFQA